VKLTPKNEQNLKEQVGQMSSDRNMRKN